MKKGFFIVFLLIIISGIVFSQNRLMNTTWETTGNGTKHTIVFTQNGFSWKAEDFQINGINFQGRNEVGTYKIQGEMVNMYTSQVTYTGILIGDILNISSNWIGGWEFHRVQLHTQKQQKNENQTKAQVFFEQGLKNLADKKYDQAFIDFSQCLQLNPNHAEAYYQRSRASIDDEQILSDLSNAIRLDPNNGEYYSGRASFYYIFLGNFNQAIIDYTQAIRLNPSDENYYRERGHVYKEMKDYNKAIDDYTQVIKLDPKNVWAYISRGDFYRDIMKDNLKAIDDYTQAISLDPNQAIIYFNRGLAYHNMKNYNQAISDFSQAIKLDPNNKNSYIWRGNAYEWINDYRRAQVDYETTLKFDQNNTAARDGLNRLLNLR